MRSLLFGLAQLAGAACALYAVATLAGWPWALLIFGVALGAAATWSEALSDRARWVEVIEDGRPVRRLKDGGS